MCRKNEQTYDIIPISEGLLLAKEFEYLLYTLIFIELLTVAFYVVNVFISSDHIDCIILTVHVIILFYSTIN